MFLLTLADWKDSGSDPNYSLPELDFNRCLIPRADSLGFLVIWLIFLKYKPFLSNESKVWLTHYPFGLSLSTSTSRTQLRYH